MMWHWLVTHGLYQALVGSCVGVFVTMGIVGLIIRPTLLRVKRAWRAHEATQRTIAQRLDPSTPGGLGDLPKAIAEEINIDRGQE